MGFMQKVSVGTTPVGLNLQGGDKILIRCETADITVAYDRQDLADGNQVFLLKSGEVVVLDAFQTATVPITGIIWAKTASGTADVYIWSLSRGGV